MCTLLRDLTGVQRLSFVRNNASVKGTLLTWYNRFVILILKTDSQERFQKCPPCPEKSWWSWTHSVEEQTVTLTKVPAKCVEMSRQAYDDAIEPLLEILRKSMENEEEDPDPMSRV